MTETGDACSLLSASTALSTGVLVKSRSKPINVQHTMGLAFSRKEPFSSKKKVALASEIFRIGLRMTCRAVKKIA